MQVDFVAAAYITLWLFVLYGIAGVVVEMIYCWTIEFKGVIESRTGILYLPFNPLYGLGGVVISLVLVPIFEHPILVFLLGMLVGSVLEFVASYVMEKVFHAVYWDYSDEPFNIQGRICLKYAFFWGLLSIGLLYVLDVINLYVLAYVFGASGIPLLIVALIAITLSIVLTLATFVRTRQKVAHLKAVAAGEQWVLATPLWARFVDALVPDSVLVNTFPRMSLIVEYQELTGIHRKVIFWQPQLGTTSPLRREAGARSARQVAYETAMMRGGTNVAKLEADGAVG